MGQKHWYRRGTVLYRMKILWSKRWGAALVGRRPVIALWKTFWIRIQEAKFAKNLAKKCWKLINFFLSKPVLGLDLRSCTTIDMFHCFCHVSGPILSPGDISSTCAPPGPRFVLHHISSSVSVALKLVKVIDNADGVENNPCCGPGSKLFCRIHIIRMVCKKK